MKLEDLFTLSMSEVIDWLEGNSDKYYLVPKTFMSEFDKEWVEEQAEAIEEGAPRGEVLDSMDMCETMLFTLNTIIEGK